MAQQVQNRSEILFLYDVKRCNPNGDPLDGNRPRIDEESGRCLVTDVRLKRTVRDYLMNKGFGEGSAKGDIFIRDEDGKAVTGTKRAKSYTGKDDFLQKFIDVRLFGGVSAPKKEKVDKKKAAEKVEDTEGGDDNATDEKKTFHFTGPVQFSMGFSLNRVQENFIKGTGAFTTSETAIQKTFREEYNITYGLIAFHGVVNENAAKTTKTTDDDIAELTEGLWNGTKDLLTRSKKGHMPRLLLKIDYKAGFFIGDLCERLSIKPNEGKRTDALEDVADYQLDVSALNAALRKHADKIISVYLETDDRLELTEPIFTK
jgi:CRISPR-associated protein Csh2